ncbi:hypothetical protein [Janthinobacterium sp. B9-8]|uniref:hypothetical protein n=1 Tax=Janthinobacterium sp. B9-8 TaxID=1236179 RepID=UPI00061D230A|nr:hypothetical protein [Janthinobacterium sp. B9-8]AMC34105.1 hypothetical protein VN23_05595 [Janthinobacterium sp. B9-8]
MKCFFYGVKVREANSTLFFRTVARETFDPAYCVEVVDLNQVSIDELVNKYAADREFVDLLKGVKGYQFVCRVKVLDAGENKAQKLLLTNEDSM